MRRLRRIRRVAGINLVLLRHGLDEVVLATPLLKPLRFLKFFMVWRLLDRSEATRGVRIRRALEDLGPLYVKFGQILSTRRDLVPLDIADELSRLQDRVPPFPGREAREIIEQAYRKPIEAVFAEFDEVPLASASVAQVHAARLLDGTEVVVKVIRPNIERGIDSDLDLMYTVAELAERYWPEGRWLRPREVVREFDKNLHDELDLMREGANATQLRRNFTDSPLLYVPEVHWDYTRRQVMVMERIKGVPVSDVATLLELGVDMKKLAERGVEIFFSQVFRDSFFHGDMHPGNIFVNPSHPDDPQYIAVDFGIIGTLNPKDHRYLAENFLAFFNRDFRRVAELHVESGWVPPHTRVDEFESAIRTVCEPIFERPLRDISFGNLLLRLFQTGRRFDMEVQPQLVLLQKTLLNIEGLGRDLYPELDLWRTARPYMERWMSEQLGSRAFLKQLRKELPRWGEIMPALPGQLSHALQELAQARHELAEQSNELERLRHDVRTASSRFVTGVAGAALIVSAFIMLSIGGVPERLADIPSISWLIGGIGSLLIFIAWRQGGPD